MMIGRDAVLGHQNVKDHFPSFPGVSSSFQDRSCLWMTHPDLAMVLTLLLILVERQVLQGRQLLKVVQDSMALQISGSQGLALQMVKMSTVPLSVAQKNICLSVRYLLMQSRSTSASMSMQRPPSQQSTMKRQMSDFRFMVWQIQGSNFQRSYSSIFFISRSQLRQTLKGWFKDFNIVLCLSGRGPSQTQNGLRSLGFNLDFLEEGWELGMCYCVMGEASLSQFARSQLGEGSKGLRSRQRLKLRMENRRKTSKMMMNLLNRGWLIVLKRMIGFYCQSSCYQVQDMLMYL